MSNINFVSLGDNMIKLLITDLDDTLYSWIGFFIPAFNAMVNELSVILNKNKNELLKEYKEVHQKKGSVEYPYATMCLPSVQNAYPNSTKEELKNKLNSAFHKFNSIRKSQLKLYPNVKTTLTDLVQSKIKIVGYTESAAENGFYRLKRLEIDHLFHAVYVSDSQYDLPKSISLSSKTHIVHGKKPNPNLLKEICEQEDVLLSEAIYIGDSLTKDIYMAKKAGILSVLCDYPFCSDRMKEWYNQLVAISHWTEEDFQQEKNLKKICLENKIKPDYIIHSFDELLKIIISNNLK